MKREFSVIGTRAPMLDAGAKVTGAAQFIDDIILPGMLHGKLLRSPLPHARIVRIDVSKARNLPGVKGVITGQDIPDRKYGIVPKAKDEYALARDKVRYIGDEVAAVCAVDPETAEEAVSLIRVEYEELPAVFDPLDAMKEGAPVLHEEVPNNVSTGIRKNFGDGEKAFNACDLVFEDTFYSQAVNHAPLEPHGAVARFDPLHGDLTVWSSTQIPFFLRRNLASTLLVPESKIRVIKPKVGGGFGGKIDMFAKDFCAAWFAMKLGRPVKFVYDREEVFMRTRQRHPMYVTVKTGMMKDGTIHAQRFWAYADGGAGWKEKRGKLPYGRGVGLGGASFPSGVSNMSHLASGAIVQIGQDGAVNVLTGAADIGQGAETVIGQIVAEEIGVPLEDVRVTAADTGITPLDSGTFGSGVTVRAGNAAWEAAAAAKRKLFEFIAPRFDVGPEDLAARDRKIFVKNNPEKSLRFLDALKDYRYADLPMPIIGRGSWMAPATEPTTLMKGDGNFAPNYSFMTQAAEVEVDIKTGKVTVVKMATAHDCGTALNPLLVEGQLEGSIIGGMGQALYEEVVMEGGQVMNPSFLDYGMPTSMEMPDMESHEVETDDPVGPFGAKESGEGTQLAPAPAIVNAIYDAIGIDFNELPITSEKILKKLEEKKEHKSQGGKK